MVWMGDVKNVSSRHFRRSAQCGYWKKTKQKKQKVKLMINWGWTTDDGLIPTSRRRAWDQIPRWSSQRPACGWQTHPPSASCSNSLLPVWGRFPRSSTLGANIRGQLCMMLFWVFFFLGKINELKVGQLFHNRPWGSNYSPPPPPPPPPKKWKSCSCVQT